MGGVNVLCMNAGDDESSYANNSNIQKKVIQNSRIFLEETMKKSGTIRFPECFKMVDMGCSSGTNTLLVVTNIVNIVHKICHERKLKAPEIQVYLNDLPDNDFNTIFKMVPQFCSKLENGEGDKSSKCFISGVPGSFYTRLLPSKSIHFVHSSYSLHWLSQQLQVPEKLGNYNKGNIYISKASPPGVYEAYFDQYKADFSKFLQLRSEEVSPNGQMVLTFAGRSNADPTSNDCCCKWELLAKSLQDMSAKGFIHDDEIDSLNLPLYTPCVNEVKDIVHYEGSFTIDHLETHEVNWDLSNDEVESASDKNNSGKIVAKAVRAVVEPMLANHFRTGNSFMDKLFERLILMESLCNI
ncbi:hypothetical protein AgCh_000527 [Apium graveolens]